ncbi:MAG: hypothetical protein ACFFDT_30175, partial [Candidatus Hodarchaeota archaeon]
TNRSKKPLIVPISLTMILTSIALITFLSAQRVHVELPPHPEIHPNLSRDGSNYSGFIDVTIPLNISNHSPASLKNGNVLVSLSVVSIENFGLFPDTTLVNISEAIQTIYPNDFTQIVINVNISSLIPILAVFDAYLVLDFDIRLDFQLGLFSFPIHLVGRVQDTWNAPFSI